MSEEIPAILSEQPAAQEVYAGSMGETFRVAREKLGMDIGDAAEKLRLSRRQLAALESDDLASLPSPTFIRGFIRNYARLLQLDPEPLLEAYRVVAPESAGNVSITLPSEEIPILAGDRKTWLPYLLASLIVGVAGGGWWAYMDWRDRMPVEAEVAVKKEAPKPTAPAPVPEPSLPVETLPMPSEPQQLPAAIGETPAVPANVAAPVSVATSAVPAVPEASAAGTAHIGLKFTQQSWVRVFDRDGKEILQKNGLAGSEQAVDGAPPFKLEIGNAAGVQLSYKGQPVDLAPHTKANVARLTLE